MRGINLIIAFILAITLAQSTKLHNQKKHSGAGDDVIPTVKFVRNHGEVRAIHQKVNNLLGSWQKIAQEATNLISFPITPEEIKTVNTAITLGYSPEYVDSFIHSVPLEELYIHLGNVARIHQLVEKKTGYGIASLARAISELIGRGVRVEDAYKAVCNLAENSIAENWGSVDPLVADIESWPVDKLVENIAKAF